MSRISQCFDEAKSRRRKVLVPYIAAGDAAPDETVHLMRALAEAGADMIELGVPFSDPMADGVVIQQAYERALAHNVRLLDVLDMVAEFRQSDAQTPVILMGYENPIEALGLENFAAKAEKAGVDGVLTVDLPVEEADDAIACLSARSIDPIFLLSPMTAGERISKICSVARGFVYYVSLKGITGAGHLDIGSVRKHVAAIRAHTSLPIGVGFGIKDGASAATVADIADAVVIGSALVKIIGQSNETFAVRKKSVVALISSIRRAIDAEPVGVAV